MNILGIETSCDETSAAVLKDGCRISSNIIASQHDIHSLYGGVVPELACRRHMEVINSVVEKSLKEAGLSPRDIDLITVTQGPGLIVALLVGVSYAKGMACGLGKPLVGVNHLEGHILSPYLENPEIGFPNISLLISGGHTDLYLVKDFGKYTLLGRTRDDAAGEALDKGAKMLGLKYPGGPLIERLANNGSPSAIPFPRIMLEKNSLDFSFSGLKTSLRNYLKKNFSDEVPEYALPDLTASYQAAVFEVLVKKALLAAEKEGVQNVVISGGVSANKTLRESFKEACSMKKISFHCPAPVLSTDNAAMIAFAGYKSYLKKPEEYQDYLSLDANPGLRL